MDLIVLRGLKNVFGLDGPSYWTQLKRRPLEIVEWEDSLVKNEIDQIVGEAVDKVPQTPLVVSSSNLQSDDYEVV